MISRAGAASLLEQLDRTEGTVISVEAEHGLFANLPIPVWEPAVVSDIVKLPERERIYKVLASHPELPPDRIPVTPPEDVYCTVADQKLIQFMSRAATKWNGIRQVLREDRIQPEQAIYFGDDNDDIEPIRMCGRGVAVSNALAHIRQAADDIADSNDNDGVAKYLAGLMG
jgi:hydroxymethylpyrimidine pyrophosphatase-like HAD family hydrolase